MRTIEHDWVDFKALLDAKNAAVQYIETVRGAVTYYDIWFNDSEVTYTCRIEQETPASSDQTDFETNYKPAANIPLVRHNTEGATIVEVTPRVTGIGKNFYTPNACDKCTWWDGSTPITDQALTNSGDQLTYTSPHPCWITVQHGKLFREDNIVLAVPTLAVKVEVQVAGTGPWVLKTEKTLNNGNTGDYTVNYVAGSITFDSALGATDLVRASYHYESGFLTTIAPTAGKVLKVYRAEMQFTENVDLNTIIRYQVWAYNPFDLPNKIQIDETAYKSMTDIMQESVGAFPAMPALGLTNGFANPVHTVRFEYPSILPLKSSQGLELRIKLDNNIAFGGEFANTTIYCVEEDE